MTEAGAAFQQTASEVLARLDQARDDADAGVSRLAGPIRTTAPLSFGITHLAPTLTTFAVHNPQGHSVLPWELNLSGGGVT